nr:venom protein [Lampona murina]
MIWAFSLIFLISIGGSLCDECRIKSMEQCDRSLLPDSFPQSAEEFMTGCRNLQRLGNCLVDVLSDCEGANKNEIKDIREDVDYLSTMCVDDNPTFKAISNNLQCIEPHIHRAYMGCSLISQDNHDILNEQMSPLLEGGASDTFVCLDSLMEVKCPAVFIGYKCGDDAKVATEDILLHFGHRESIVCTPKMIEELEPFLEIFEGILLEQFKLEDELEERK